MDPCYLSNLHIQPNISGNSIFTTYLQYDPGDAYGEGFMLTRAPHVTLGLISRHLILIFPRWCISIQIFCRLHFEALWLSYQGKEN